MEPLPTQKLVVGVGATIFPVNEAIHLKKGSKTTPTLLHHKLAPHKGQP